MHRFKCRQKEFFYADHVLGRFSQTSNHIRSALLQID